VVGRDGCWIDVPSIEGGFVVNIGDTMEVWTNRSYVSNQYRVLSDGRERWSLPFFFASDYFQEIRPLPQFLILGETSRYGTFISGVHKLSEYSKGFYYLKTLARKGELELESAPDEISRFSKTAN